MNKTIKRFLIASTVLSTIALTATIVIALVLSRYRSNVNDEIFDMGLPDSQTLFYCYEFSSRETRRGTVQLIEDAKLDNGVKYRQISYDSIPQDLINAFVAIEDKRFFRHNGIDFSRTAKAIVHYILGGRSFGGSTITQQLVKNLTGNDSPRVTRKISEALSAVDIEKDHDKTEIMEMYLNIINLSEGCRGIRAASEFFYSKEPNELTLSECATIAAITNNPSKYDPLRHPENNIKRRNIILKCMLEQGYISNSDYKTAVSVPIKLNLSKNNAQNNINSWYIDMVTKDVINDMCQKYGISAELASLKLYNGGYRIYTAMDKQIQDTLDSMFSSGFGLCKSEEDNEPEASMIVIDPNTGDILAVAGALGRKSGNRIQNYATDTKRPPGSAIKPLSVYAPALEENIINWSSVISDTPVKISNNGRPWPLNANRQYAGNVTVKYALENSLNTVAVRVLHQIGNDRSVDFLRNKLKISNYSAKCDVGDAALALGQPSNGITLKELTAAYSIFFDGIMKSPRSYFKVTDINGKIILDNTGSQEYAISDANAAIMTKLLQNVVENGTASGKVSLTDITEVAGKTGTTQGNFDKYFIGYTPQLIAGVWFGYEYPKSLDSYGGNISISIWDAVMNKIYRETGYVSRDAVFKIPDSICRLTYNSKTGKYPSLNDSADDEIGWFIAEE